jgi:hypothetical protein
MHGDESTYSFRRDPRVDGGDRVAELLILLFTPVAGAAFLVAAYFLPRPISPYVAFLGFVVLTVSVIAPAFSGEPGGLIVAIAGIVAFLLIRRAARDRRRHALAGLAAANGMSFWRADPRAELVTGFPGFSQGDGQRFENVIDGEWKGLRVMAADYSYFVVKGVWAGWQMKRWYRLSAVVAYLDVDVPTVTIAEEQVVDRLGRPDLDFELEAFNRRYRVESQDRQFAFKLIDARMMRWLMQLGPGHGLELVGNRALLYRPCVSPADAAGLFDNALAFQDRIPRVGRTEYAIP